MSQDAPLTEDQLAALLQELPSWEIRDGWLRRKFTTAGWPHTLLLVNAIGYVAEAGWHHPDLEVGYARVVVKLKTHSAQALTQKDAALARKIEEVALWLPAKDSALEGFPKNWTR
ncbi:MAG: 4a-hydroxytetrahydrobiopterin dehydratase [Planctomycetaceae bacterium]|nr:4a-hydroxytetrahydrobiopterin dehydratase [Planctomycetaceae bacterium]MCB9954123.1 4a-hydroxytetrahydrobiopterin dehydratase [Planctomycetaceae bacterium]